MTGKRTPLEIQELAQEADKLLNSPFWKLVHFELRQEYFNTLLTEQPYSLTAQHAHARLRALEDVVAKLNSFKTEEQMQRRKG